MSEAHRRLWAATVAKLVYPADPARATTKIVEYLPFLSDLPPEAFNPHSAEAVALAERRMALPSMDEIAKPLRAWWDQHRPRRPALPSAGADLDEIDWSWMRFWQTRNAEGFCRCGKNGCTKTREHAASLIRQQSPRAWAHIQGNRI